MYSIGDFAQLGRVSVRMLRHYDALGLLAPAHVDKDTGYRSYRAAQLSDLNRVLAFKDLGFSLQQVKDLLDEDLDVAELKGMLRLRRLELATTLAADRERLARVEARLRLIETEGLASDLHVLVKHVPSLRVAALSAIASGYEPDDIGPVIGPLFERLDDLLASSGCSSSGPGIATYQPVSGGVRVQATCPVASDVTTADLPREAGLRVVDLPPIEAAATVYRGRMSDSSVVTHALARWIDAHGYLAVGYARELYLDCPQDQRDWVTEFQLPVEPGPGAASPATAIGEETS